MIIGITGTLGAGKGTVVEILQEYGYKHYSVRDFIAAEIFRQGLDINRDTMVLVANALREQYGSSYITDALLLQVKKEGDKNAVIESVRTVGEIDNLRKEKDFVLWAVDADIRLRYERISLRKSATDMISFDTFVANEQRELTSTDPNKQNLSECIKRADKLFMNNGSIEDLKQEIINYDTKNFSY